MYYSITFTTARPDNGPIFFSLDNRTYKRKPVKNTWIDWHLIPLERPSIAPPEVKTKTIEVPGMNGDLDFTESLTGYPVYKNREGDIEFMVETGHEDWNEVYQSMCSYLHGRKLYFALEDDPGYYYYGRITVDQYQSQKDNSKITIHYETDPQKYDYCNGQQGDAWWDVFDFESDNLDTIKYTDKFNDLSIDSVDYINICTNNEWGNFTEFPVIPTILVSTADPTDSITIHFINTELGIEFEKTLMRGTYILPQLVISQRNNLGKTYRYISINDSPPYDVQQIGYGEMNYGDVDINLKLEAKGRGRLSLLCYPGRK